MVDRVQVRLAALVTIVRGRKLTDTVLAGAEEFLRRWVDDVAGREQVRTEARVWILQMQAVIGNGARRALRPGADPAAALRVARAVWRLLDQPDDVPRRAELALLGKRLGDALRDGRAADARVTVDAISAWCDQHEWAITYAIRRIVDAP